MADVVGHAEPLSTSPATSIIALSSSATAIPPTRAIWCTVTGTADITDCNGNTLTGVVFAVGWHPISVTVVNNISGATLYAAR